MKTRVLVFSLLVACAACPALADPIPLAANRQIDIQVSNDNGARLGSGPNDTYYIDASGGGLNQLHITTDSTSAGVSGQVTTRNIATSTASGTFWTSTTGGRGYNDTIVLMASIQGPIANDFALTIKSSGYQWTPSTSLGADIHYVDGAVQETFGKSDFLYGPNSAKPGPGNGWILPFYSGQDINDPSTASYMLFIDLYVGNVSGSGRTDSGDAKVEFSVSGLYDTTLAFNVYAYALNANIANGSINWTNRLSTNLADPNQSGYSITTTALEPTPLPPTFWLLGSTLGGAWLVGRRTRARRKDTQA